MAFTSMTQAASGLAEYEGVVVRSTRGKVLGLFNSKASGINATIHVANFALAGDALLILDVQRLLECEASADGS